MGLGVIGCATAGSNNLTQDNKWRVFNKEGNEMSGSLNFWAILENLRDWQLLKKDSAPWS
jgi:hypothetical protein